MTQLTLSDIPASLRDKPLNWIEATEENCRGKCTKLVLIAIPFRRQNTQEWEYDFQVSRIGGYAGKYVFDDDRHDSYCGYYEMENVDYFMPII